MKPQLLLLTPLLVPTISESQTVCFQYAGGMISCDLGEGRNTRKYRSRESGILLTEQSLEPYRPLDSNAPGVSDVPAKLGARSMFRKAKNKVLESLDRSLAAPFY